METPTPAHISQMTADQLDQLLESSRALSSQVKAVEVAILREVDRRQIPLGDGMRTLEDWVIGRMDVSRSTARDLMAVAKADSARLDEMLAEEGVSFDRVSLLAKAGSTDPREDLDMIGLRVHLARRAPIEQEDEETEFERRFLAIQPTLDESAWRLWGQLPALEGRSSPTPSTPSPTSCRIQPLAIGSLGRLVGPTPSSSCVTARSAPLVRPLRSHHRRRCSSTPPTGRPVQERGSWRGPRSGH